MKVFSATIEIIGINPYVLIPQPVLKYLLQQFGKEKGQVPVLLKINGQNFTQTLVRYAGACRLYLNMPMRKAAGKDVGDKIKIEIDYDGSERLTALHPVLEKALKKNTAVGEKFASLSPSLQKEIKRYINNLKTADAVERNVQKAVLFLRGQGRFIGRDTS